MFPFRVEVYNYKTKSNRERHPYCTYYIIDPKVFIFNCSSVRHVTEVHVSVEPFPVFEAIKRSCQKNNAVKKINAVVTNNYTHFQNSY